VDQASIVFPTRCGSDLSFSKNVLILDPWNFRISTRCVSKKLRHLCMGSVCAHTQTSGYMKVMPRSTPIYTNHTKAIPLDNIDKAPHNMNNRNSQRKNNFICKTLMNEQDGSIDKKSVLYKMAI
jgi:hypothetical protein